MSATAYSLHEPHLAPRSAGARVWRPFPSEVADLVCVDHDAPDVQPRIHERFSITLIGAPTHVRAESARPVSAERDAMLLVPAWQLHALRAEESASEGGTVTFLLGTSLLGGIALDRAVLVTDTAVGAELRAVVSQLRRPVRSIQCATTMHGLVERLMARATLLRGFTRSPLAVPLAPVRDYLREHLAEPVSIAELAEFSGLTESHLIRAFHMEFGLPPHAYHLRLRLAAASELLGSGVPVSTAAYECGFADQSHLSRKFREIYGTTPATWAAAVRGRRAGPFADDAWLRASRPSTSAVAAG